METTKGLTNVQVCVKFKKNISQEEIQNKWQGFQRDRKSRKTMLIKIMWQQKWERLRREKGGVAIKEERRGKVKREGKEK